MSFEVRTYQNQDYEMVREWANKEGWNQGIHDHLAFRQFNKGGFFIGVLDGQPIVNICFAQYDENFAFFGLYIAKPQHRGKGYSLQLCKHIFQKIAAKNIKNIALQGVLSMQHNYAKLGFKAHHKTIRYTTFGTSNKKSHQNLRECKDIDFEKLAAYDRLNFPAERKEFLKKWINLPQSRAIAFVKQGDIQGYGVIRRSHQGFRVGPLFADTYQASQSILQHFLGQLSQQAKVTIDIPDINLQALKLAQNFKMTSDFQCARMYSNGMPNLPFHKTVYGVTMIQFG